MGHERAWDGQLLLGVSRHVGDGQDILAPGARRKTTKALRSTCGVPALGLTLLAQNQHMLLLAAAAKQQGTSFARPETRWSKNEPNRFKIAFCKFHFSSHVFCSLILARSTARTMHRTVDRGPTVGLCVRPVASPATA